MSERLKALRRVRAVQAQVKRMAEGRLAAAERREAALADAAADLGAFVAEGCPAGDLARLAVLQTRRLALQRRDAEAERAARAETVAEADRRHRLTERRIEELDADVRRAAERRDLQNLLDAFLARPGEAD